MRVVLPLTIASVLAQGETVQADEPSTRSPDESRRAAEEATTALPSKTQIEFKPSYTFPNGASRYKTELLFETILPYDGIGIPGVTAAGFWSIARVQLPARSLEDAQGPASGLGDLTFVDLAAHWLGPLAVGLGYGAVFPMSTTPALGQGKLQIGPALGLRLDTVSWLKLAGLVQSLWSVAGSSNEPDLAYVSVQPFVAVHLPLSLFVSSDATMSFYWQGGRSTIPVNVGFGAAFSKYFVGAIKSQYTVADEHEGDVMIQVVLDFQPDPASQGERNCSTAPPASP